VRLTKSINLLLVLAALVVVAVWLVSARSSQATSQPATEDKPKPVAAKTDAGYVGTDVCKDCHEDQFKAYSHTTHADLAKVSSWKTR